MISWFLSKNNTRTTTPEELIDILVQNKDLMYSEGITNISGIPLYHFKQDGAGAGFSYGSVLLTLRRETKNSPVWVVLGTKSGSLGEGNILNLQICSKSDEVIFFGSRGMETIPTSAFESETDFFQYTTLNLEYSCSDASLLKLTNFIMEFMNERS